MVPKLILCLLIFSFSTVAKSDGHQCDETVRHLGEDDWQDILKGKWVVKFYANWCPACQSFKADFEELAKVFRAEGFCAAAADVSLNAGLSGRFFVTSLPTFYLIQEGEIRMYNGVRSKEALGRFVLEEAWVDAPVVPWYISPTSYHMAALGTFFRLSMALRNFHTHITEKWGVPVWMSYISFALFTIFVGLLFGLFIVFLCDLSLGPVAPDEQKKRADPFGMETTIADTEEDVVDDNREVEGRSEEEEEDDEEEEEDEEEQEGVGVEDLEADDEGEEPKKDSGSGEPRRRKKASHGDDDDDDDDDDGDHHQYVGEEEEEKKK